MMEGKDIIKIKFGDYPEYELDGNILRRSDFTSVTIENNDINAILEAEGKERYELTCKIFAKYLPVIWLRI